MLVMDFNDEGSPSSGHCAITSQHTFTVYKYVSGQILTISLGVAFSIFTFAPDAVCVRVCTALIDSHLTGNTSQMKQNGCYSVRSLAVSHCSVKEGLNVISCRDMPVSSPGM